MNDVYEKVLQNITHFRKSQNLTSEQLAFNSDLSKSTISRIENGEADPRLKTLIKIANTLNIHPKELFR